MVLVIGESKAGHGAARGLSADYESFSSLVKDSDDWIQLEKHAIETLQEQMKRGRIAAAADTSADALRKSHAAELEATMRDMFTSDMGQIARDFERMMPNAGSEFTTILIDGKPVRVKVDRGTTKIAATAPTDLSLDAATQAGKDYGAVVERLDVGVDTARLEAIARQLRAEQITNGSRLPVP